MGLRKTTLGGLFSWQSLFSQQKNHYFQSDMKSRNLSNQTVYIKNRFVELFFSLLVAFFIVAYEFGIRLVSGELEWVNVLSVVSAFSLLLINIYFSNFAKFGYLIFILIIQIFPNINFDTATLGFYFLFICVLIEKGFQLYISGVILYLSVVVTFSSSPAEAFIANFIELTIVTAVGIMASVVARRINESTEAELALSSIRSELASQLHDTIAKDIARTVILAEQISFKHPDIAHELDEMIISARQAARRIHPIIYSLRDTYREFSIPETVEKVKLMLTTRSLILDTEIEDIFSDALNKNLQILISLFISEAATNVLKYAQPNTTVNLNITNDAGVLTLLMENIISNQAVATELTGGYGLQNLAQKFSENGGYLEFGKHNNNWRIVAVIPCE